MIWWIRGMLRQNMLQRFSRQGTRCAIDVLVSVIVVDGVRLQLVWCREVGTVHDYMCPWMRVSVGPCIRVCTVYILTQSRRVHSLFMLYRNVCKRDNIKSNYPLSWSCCTLWRLFIYAMSMTDVLLQQNDRSWATQPTLKILPPTERCVLLATDL